MISNTIGFTQFIVWIFLGLPYLYYIFFTNDFVIFIDNAFNNEVRNKIVLDEIGPLDCKILKKLCKKLKNDFDEIELQSFNSIYTYNLLNIFSNDKFSKYHYFLNIQGYSISKKDFVLGKTFSPKFEKNFVQRFSFIVNNGSEVDEESDKKIEIKVLQAKNFLKGFSINGKINISYILDLLKEFKINNDISYKKKLKSGILKIVNFEKMNELQLKN